LGESEIWGEWDREDPLSHYFRDKMESVEMVDIKLLALSPIWMKNRASSKGVHKQLDRFLVQHHLLSNIGILITWVSKFKISYHFLVILEFDLPRERSGAHFKFNLSWLEFGCFKSLVEGVWVGYEPNLSMNGSQQFVTSLKKLKMIVVKWDLNQRKERDSSQVGIEKELGMIYNKVVWGLVEWPDIDKVRNLEENLYKFLLE
jgi:hypothetical protein